VSDIVDRLVQLLTLISDTYEVATIAKEYTVNNGPADPVFLQYFGNAHDAYVKVLGVWESILTGNKDGVLFRCDNIDGVSTHQT
jgi:hypothetical protein